MPLGTNKKILINFFLLIILGTLQNLSLNEINYPKVKKIDVFGLGKNENQKLSYQLEFLKFQDLFFLDQSKIDQILSSNNLIESYTVNKIFPSTLKIDIKETQILANTYKDGSNFLIGTNGKLIPTKIKRNDKPFVVGNFLIEEFLLFKKIIDRSHLNYNEIKKIFFFNSGRWDIEMNNGLLLKLPKTRTEDAINLSMKLISKDEFLKAKIIDTRMKNQVILNEK